MRVTCKFSARNGKGVTRFPLPKWDIDACKRDDGTIDDGKLMQSLAIDGVIGGKDNGPVYYVANEFLYAMERIVAKMEADEQNVDMTDKEREREERKIRQVIKKIDDGRVGYVRFRIEWSGSCTGKGHIRITIEFDPNGVVGDAEQYGWTFAVDAARLCLHMRGLFAEVTETDIELREGKGAAGLLKEAAKQNLWFEQRDAEIGKLEERRNRRDGCPHRRFDLCVASDDGTPPDFSCPLYINGKCQVPVLPEKYQKAPETEFGNNE